ncbi:helix-turn-helix transcriptional regulator [Mycolicibacterium sp. XJ879]
MPVRRPSDLAALTGLSHLEDPVRRQLYECVAESEAPISREQAAAVVGIGRTLAAYHLDKLADAGLLTISYQRLTGRDGPGAGRPAKLYARAPGEMTISVPPRDYELLARLLVGAVEKDDSGAVKAAVDGAAFEAGRTVGTESAPDIVGALRRCGYQPHVDDDCVSLRNCPFHMVARDHLEVVCGLNLRLVEGILAGCDQPRAHAELTPHPDRCCVVVRGVEPHD